MVMARARPVDPSVTRWCHWVSHCVRRAFLLAEGSIDRKLWIENRLADLSQFFSIAVGTRGLGTCGRPEFLGTRVQLDFPVFPGDAGSAWEHGFMPSSSFSAGQVGLTPTRVGQAVER
jgi:hypothetical protein